MINERAKFEVSDTPAFLEDEWEEYHKCEVDECLIAIPPQTMAKLLKLKNSEETVSDFIERLLSEYELVGDEE